MSVCMLIYVLHECACLGLCFHVGFILKKTHRHRNMYEAQSPLIEFSIVIKLKPNNQSTK